MAMDRKSNYPMDLYVYDVAYIDAQHRMDCVCVRKKKWNASYDTWEVITEKSIVCNAMLGLRAAENRFSKFSNGERNKENCFTYDSFLFSMVPLYRSATRI